LDNITVLSVAPLFAEAIRRIHTGESVGELFHWGFADRARSETVPPIEEPGRGFLAMNTNLSGATALSIVTSTQHKHLLIELLRGVSRTFYFTLRILPRGLRESVGLAYLLARAADTIADTRLLPPEERLKHLLAFREQVRGPATLSALQEIAQALTEKQSLDKERTLLRSLPEAFAMLEALPAVDRIQVRTVVLTLTQGMEIDLTRFPAEDTGQVKALKDNAALDCYIYSVAGCVGEFWTTMTRAHTRAAVVGCDTDGRYWRLFWKSIAID
jgi:hypothetical protein